MSTRAFKALLAVGALTFGIGSSAFAAQETSPGACCYARYAHLQICADGGLSMPNETAPFRTIERREPWKLSQKCYLVE